LLNYIKRWLGFEKQTQYVRNYFFKTNMIAGIYMSIVYIIIEIWMILRITGIMLNDKHHPGIGYYFRKYYFYYFLLLAAAVTMLLFALRYIRGKTNNQRLGTALKWMFAFIGIYFGTRIAINDYSKGEQILAFITMEVVVLCLLVWRPWTAFLILTATYLNFYYQIDRVVPVNAAYNAIIHNTEAVKGATPATAINLFTMWIATIMFCISNFNKTLVQAEKDENLEKINSHLKENSVIDELTGIHNMVYFRRESDKLFSDENAVKDDLVFLFMDIENFKSYNETYGFHKGNELLSEIAHMIDSYFSGSIVSRFSDDHFVVLAHGKDCIQKIDKISDELKDLQGEVHLELKCGAYKYVEGELDTSLACDRARFACNSIKKHYDKNFRIYDKSLEDLFQQKQYIVNNIDVAIENKYICVFYQPVLSTATGKICGLEALARWHDPNYGMLSPAQFISTLEEYRQIHKLDKYMIEQVCLDYVSAKENKQVFAPVSINFSRLDFELCYIAEYLNRMLEKYGVPKHFIDVEITESALIDQLDFLPDEIAHLRNTGYSVWLDDFGSGYSSLNVLKDYTFDVLKIDMKFLNGFADNEKTKPILRNIVNLTKQLNMTSLSEGVENAEQFEFLKEIGCDKVQGYLFSKPVPLSELRDKIAKGELEVEEKFLP